MDKKSYLPRRLANGEGSLPIAITARIGQSGCLLMSNPDSCKVISKSDQRFLRTRLFKNFSCLYSSKSPYSPEPCLGADQNFANSIWKGSPKEHSCEIISKSDQQFPRRFFMNFYMSARCKKPQFTRAMFIDGSKFWEQFLKRVTQGTFLWNYFKI